MRRSWHVLAVVATALLLLTLAVATAEGPVELTEATFDGALQDDSTLFVEFYSPICGACKQFRPRWESFAAGVHADPDLDVTIARVCDARSPQPAARNPQPATARFRLQERARAVADGEGRLVPPQVNVQQQEGLKTRFGIKRTPTLLLFKTDGQLIEYDGDFTFDDVKNFVSVWEAEVPELVSSREAIEQFVVPVRKSGRSALVGFFENQQQAAQALQPVAPRLERAGIAVALCLDPKLSPAAGPPGLALFSTGAPSADWLMLKGTTPDEILSFAVKLSTPPYSIYDKGMAQNLLNKNFEMLALYFDQPLHAGENLAEFEKAAQQFRGLIPHVFVPEEHAAVFKQFNVRRDAVPTVMLYDTRGERRPRRFVLPVVAGDHVVATQAFTADALVQFEKLCIAGEADQFRDYRSQPPVANKPKVVVKQVVASNFEEAVVSDERDVLVFFYAPWCKHCEVFQNQYRNFATHFYEVDSLKFAKIDDVTNEVNITEVPEATAYPTLLLFPSGQRTPVQFQGQRTHENLMDFLALNVKRAFEIDGRSFGNQSTVATAAVQAAITGAATEATCGAESPERGDGACHAGAS